jgi:branched-chain amino acid:cation transporter, LIVCS family
LTTAIALAAVFADFIKKDLSQNKLGYVPSLIITLLITYFISTLEFNGIVKLLAPILQICYPALILLTVLNIAYKLFHFKPVKVPVLVVFIASLIGYLL